MYLLWFLICVSILKENLATNDEETSNDDLLVNSKQYCKWVDHHYGLCEDHNLTGTTLRANCQLKNREWGSEVMLSFEIAEPQKTPYELTPKCVFNTTYIGEYICSLRMDVSKLEYKTEINCTAVYKTRDFEQKQKKHIFDKKNTYFEKHPSFDPAVWTRRPLINCQKMGTRYKKLAWDLDVKKGRRNGMTQNVTLYTPGELNANCALACFTHIEAGDDWNLTWRLDDTIKMNGPVESPTPFKLPLAINLSKEHNGKTLKCSLILKRANVGIFNIMMIETILLLPDDHRDALAANEQELADSTSAEENKDNKDSSMIIVSAAAVGAIVCLVLLVAVIIFCRRRCCNASSAPTENNNDKDEDGGYTELTIHKVVYANLALPQNNEEFATTPMAEYAEIIGIITDNNDRRLCRS